MRELLLRIDVDTVTWFCMRRRRLMDQAMRFITHLGDGRLWVSLSILLTILSSNGLVLFGRLALGYSIELGVYKLIKGGVSRRRPFMELPFITGLVVPPDEFSFPSGHTAAALVMTTIVGTAFPVLFVPLLFLSLLIGISRIYLGLHYPSDALAGAVLGVASGLIGKILI
jgi:undecaprenyl-diphosphatase